MNGRSNGDDRLIRLVGAVTRFVIGFVCGGFVGFMLVAYVGMRLNRGSDDLDPVNWWIVLGIAVSAGLMAAVLGRYFGLQDELYRDRNSDHPSWPGE